MSWRGTDEVAGVVPGSYALLMLPLGYLAMHGIFPGWMWVGATLLQLAVLAAVIALAFQLIHPQAPELVQPVQPTCHPEL